MAALARHLMKEVGEILPVRRRDRELVWTGAPVETECPAVYNLAEGNQHLTIHHFYNISNPNTFQSLLMPQTSLRR